MAKSYYEKLKDPRWQKKRLEIMERAKFACEDCGDKDKTLHIHHGYYEYGKDPWDYKNNTLWCLCEDCHLAAKEATSAVRAELASFKPGHLLDLASFIHSFYKIEYSKHGWRAIANLEKQLG